MSKSGFWMTAAGQWLKAFCEAKGVGYLNRPDNAHAKAGNINHALTQTSGEFVAIFDADFVPQRNFLMRTIGFFSEAEIGIVQIPHAFYNYDPMQTNLALRKTVPDEQRFFFDAIMPSRDAWNAAFCCGSNSVTRRTALRAIGDAAADRSDYRGYAAEHGAVAQRLRHSLPMRAAGLRPGAGNRRSFLHPAPALGAGRNSNPLPRQRTVWSRFDTHAAAAVLADALANAGAQIVDHHPGPDRVPVDGHIAGVRCQHGRRACTISCRRSLRSPAASGSMRPVRIFHWLRRCKALFWPFEILPTVLQSLVMPFGHAFKVTPKGGTSQGSNYARRLFWTVAALVWLTFAGVIINTIPEWRIIQNADVLPIVAFWSVINIIVLFLVCMMSLEIPARRQRSAVGTR